TSPGATPALRRWIADSSLEPSRWFDLNYFDPAVPGATDPGLRMLAGQAAAAFERFTGIALEAAEVDDARTAAVPRGPAAC
nr:hypothetical protein [Deltaproteobacteria bacterium]